MVVFCPDDGRMSVGSAAAACAYSSVADALLPCRLPETWPLSVPPFAFRLPDICSWPDTASLAGMAIASLVSGARIPPDEEVGVFLQRLPQQSPSSGSPLC